MYDKVFRILKDIQLMSSRLGDMGEFITGKQIYSIDIWTKILNKYLDKYTQ